MKTFSGRVRPILTFCERLALIGGLVGGLVVESPAQELQTDDPPSVDGTRSAIPAAAAERVRPPRFGEARLANGVRLHFAEQGRPGGVPVILLHGYTDTWFSWSLVLPQLPDDLHVYALDQRGHGDSDRPAEGYGLDELAADVTAFMDTRGMERAVVVGHSMGGLVAQRVAAAFPERVEGLVLVSTGTTIRHVVGLDELREAVDALEGPVDPAFARSFQEGTAHGAVPPAFMERVIADSGRMPAATWQALLDGMVASGPAKRLSRHGVPTLIAWGDRDGVFTLEEQEALVALSGGTLKIYPTTGHALPWERPDTFARDLTEFALALDRRTETIRTR